MFQKFTLPSIFLLLGLSLAAQNAALQGTITDAESKLPIRDAAVTLRQTGIVVATDADGSFFIEKIRAGKYFLDVSAVGFQVAERPVEVKSNSATVVDISLKRETTEATTLTDLPMVTLEEAESSTDGAGEVANLLHASRDVFQTVSGFGWFNFRFRERGYDSEHFPVYLNGVSVNDPETGTAFFGEFGGLNDVMRRRESTVGIEANDFAFSEIGGASNIDLRASVQRKQIRASYANSNRSYAHRVMLTYSTGLMPKGWAVAVSASRRWADAWELPVAGTYFYGNSWFVSVDKKLNSKHNFNVVLLGSPSLRGRQTTSFSEMFQLTGDNLYNPSWGYQDGKVRNSAVSYSNQPIAQFRYDYTPSRKTSLTWSNYGQAGKRYDQRIEWANAGNPNADYYRRLPSFLTDPAQSAAQKAFLLADEKNRQVQWDDFFTANRFNTETVANADGIAGNSVTGQRSVYIVENRHSDSRELGSNLLLRHTLTTRINLNGGLNYQFYKGKNYKILDDLLGGDWWLDINRFAAQDFPNEPNKPQSDIRTPNNLIKEGERFGYDYDENIRKAGAWAQAQFSLKKFQFFAGAEAGQTQFWRTGNMQVGLFENNSLGDSEKFKFPTWGAKGGAVYKLNGRNYLYSNGFVGTRSPQFRDVFLAPRTRNSANSNIETFKTRAIEGGYQLRAPYYKARVTAYLTDFLGEVETYQVFSPTYNEFGTISVRNINRRHMGIEIGGEARPLFAPGFTFTTAVSVGNFKYTNRPVMDFTVDNIDRYFIQNDTVYQKNFYVPRVPQACAAFGVRYEGKKFWNASLTVNWRDGFWYDFSEFRRTRTGVAGVEAGSPLWRTIIDQQKADAAYTVDFFGGKSFRISRKHRIFLNLNLGVNNLLDNRNIIISGQEAFVNSVRDVADPRLYASRVQYGLGRNYFASATLRM